MAKSKRKNLTEGPIAPILVKLTTPMLFGIISMVLFNLVDTYFVGQLGKDQLAALTFTFPVILVVFGLVQGIGIGATALISQSIGKGDLQKAARETTDSLVLGVILAGIFVVLGLVFMEPIFRLMGVQPAIMPYVLEYMELWFMAIMFVVVPFVGNSAIRATGDALTPSLIMLFAVAINAILDPLLIFGHGPFPEMGLRGAALATAISRMFTFALSIYVLYRREKLITLKIPSRQVLSGCWKAILRIGLPSGVSRMVQPVTQFIITGLLATLGTEVVAGYGVASRVEFLASAILFALGASIGPFAGQNLGAGKINRIQRAINQTSLFSVIYSVLIAAVLYVVARPVVGVFTDNEEVMQSAATFLAIVPLTFGFQGITQTINVNLNTLNRPLVAGLIVVVQQLVLLVPLAYWLSGQMGERGIFIAIAIAYFTGGVASLAVNRIILSRMQRSHEAASAAS